MVCLYLVNEQLTSTVDNMETSITDNLDDVNLFLENTADVSCSQEMIMDCIEPFKNPLKYLCINHGDQRFFLIWSHQLIISASSEYLCYGSTPIANILIFSLRKLYLDVRFPF